jgi:hypothetical protein
MIIAMGSGNNSRMTALGAFGEWDPDGPPPIAPYLHPAVHICAVRRLSLSVHYPGAAAGGRGECGAAV